MELNSDFSFRYYILLSSGNENSLCGYKMPMFISTVSFPLFPTAVV